LINDVSDRPGDHRTAGRRAPAALVASVGVVATLATGALAGCGGGDDTTTGEPAPGAEGATTRKTSPETTTDGATTTTGGGGTAEGDAEQGRTIRDVVIAVLATGDPDRACGSDFVTDAYISAAYGDENGCVQAQTKASAADSVRIQTVKPASLDPPSATATATPEGGQYDGEQLTVKLVKEDDVWRLDSLESDAPVGP
jgi:hypothetical protein